MLNKSHVVTQLVGEKPFYPFIRETEEFVDISPRTDNADRRIFCGNTNQVST